MARLKTRPPDNPGLPDASGESSPPETSTARTVDPRWVLTPWRYKPTDAMKFYLMTGMAPGVRLHGWVALHQAGDVYNEPTPEQVWYHHGSALVAEAKAHDFTPYQVTGKRPTGAGFEAWRRAFIEAHKY